MKNAEIPMIIIVEIEYNMEPSSFMRTELELKIIKDFLDLFVSFVTS